MRCYQVPLPEGADQGGMLPRSATRGCWSRWNVTRLSYQRALIKVECYQAQLPEGADQGGMLPGSATRGR